MPALPRLPRPVAVRRLSGGLRLAMLEVIGRRANRPAYSEWQDVMDDNDKAKDQALAPPPAPTRMPRVRSAAQLGQQLVSVGRA